MLKSQNIGSSCSNVAFNKLQKNKKYLSSLFYLYRYALLNLENIYQTSLHPYNSFKILLLFLA